MTCFWCNHAALKKYQPSLEFLLDKKVTDQLLLSISYSLTLIKVFCIMYLAITSTMVMDHVFLSLYRAYYYTVLFVEIQVNSMNFINFKK